MTKNKKTVNCIAHNVSKPQRGVTCNTPSTKGAFACLHANRGGVAKLRKRGFTDTQIAAVFQRAGMPVNNIAVHNWSNVNMTSRPKMKFKMGDLVKRGKELLIVQSSNPKLKTMVLMDKDNKNMEVPMKLSMFRKVL